MKNVLKGRSACKGVCVGIALVCPESIQGWAGVDDKTGKIIEPGHSQEGVSVKDRILVLPGSKGSNGWSCHFNATRINGVAPKGWVFTKIDSSCAATVAVMNTPAVTDMDTDPISAIKTGDRVRVDGDRGVVEILKTE